MAMLASRSQHLHQQPGNSHLHSTPPSASMLSHPSPTNSDFSDGGVLDDIRSWDERKVIDWLTGMGYQKYEKVFEKNNITGETLLECDQSVLKELGISKVGDRVRIFVSIKKLRGKAFGNSKKKRNRDTLAALDNIGSLASYRQPAQSHLSPPQNRHSRIYNNTSLSSGSYSRPESPNEYDYSRSQTGRSNGPRIVSPPPESSRSPYNPPPSASGTNSSRTPRTPSGRGDRERSGSQASSPNTVRKQQSDIMNFERVRNSCIKVIGEGGATRVIDISTCSTPESIMSRILKKFGIKEDWAMWGIFSITNDHGRESTVCLGDSDLLRIVHDSSRQERTRLILRRKNSPPSPSSAEFLAAQQIAREQHDAVHTRAADAIQENGRNPKIQALTGHYAGEIRPSSPHGPGSMPTSQPSSPRSRDSSSLAINRNASKKITAFFGQRPPSELISSNLAEYFPDHEHKVLEKTVRNSVRRSARMSKYNSRLSVATTRSFASSIGSGDIPPVPSVGDVWFNTSPQATALPSTPMARTARPLSVRKSILPSTSFSGKEYLGDVPEHSPVGSERRSFMSYDSRDSGRDSLNVVVTEAEPDSEDQGTYMDTQSIISTPGTDPDTIAPSIINQLLAPEDTDEEEEDDDDEYEDDDDSVELRWMKGTLIGSGSFGSVYLALNALTGELMAVKQVELTGSSNKEDTRKQGMIEALTREIALLKDLQHQNIVQYLASNKEDNCFNIFLEYVPGGSVAAMLNNYGPLKEPLIRNFVRQILNGLAYLHGKNIIHRDIKGANVLVDNKGGIKISDFGISKKVEAGLLTSSAANHRPSLQGSVFWMAPEVVKQTSYTLKADIWSLGCLIVEMFTGSHPYPDCSQLQAIFKIGTTGSAPQIPTKSTAEAKTFLGQAFELDHNNRPTADDLLQSPFLLPLVGGQSASD